MSATTENREPRTENQLPLLNRQLPADGQFHLVPIGTFDHAESGLVEVIDRPAIEAMAHAFTPKLLVDQEHFSYYPDKSSEAYGWIESVEPRADGLWGRIDWTDLGKAAVQNGRYRFLSPVWLMDDTESVGSGRIRPIRLDSVGLTNSPNLRGMAPLSNRSGRSDGSGRSDRSDRSQPKGHEMKDKLIAVLGLAPDAADTAVVEAVGTLKNRVGALDTSVADLRKNTETLKTERDSMLAEQIERDLDQFTDVIAHREAMQKQLQANRTGTLEILRALKAPAKPALHNRAGKPTPGTTEAKPKSQQAEEFVRARMLANRCSYRDAFDLAVAEKPDLFQPEPQETA